ncbi:hypothetical protein Tco_0045773 [Tanacetum coccineum]
MNEFRLCVECGARYLRKSSEKKLNEVKLISYGLKLISGVHATMAKPRMKVDLVKSGGVALGGEKGETFRDGGGDFGVGVVLLQTCLTKILGFFEKFGGGLKNSCGWRV